MLAVSRRTTSKIACSRRSTSETSLLSLTSLLGKRGAHHAPQYNEPSGYLFGEKPPVNGQKRKREDWEMVWYIGMFGSLAVAAVGLYFKPDTSIQTWALQEAKRRMEESGEKLEYKPSQ